MNMETDNTTNWPHSSEASDTPPQAWIGWDWGDQQHAISLQMRGSDAVETLVLEDSPEDLHRWLKELEQRLGGHLVRLGIENCRTAVLAILLQYPWLEIYVINPVTSARYRSAFTPSGAKDDAPDSKICLELVRDHAPKLRPLCSEDPHTLKLKGLSVARRGIVDRRTTLLSQLSSLLKSYYPQALAVLKNLDTPMAAAFLKRWPDLISLKTAKPATLKKFFYRHNVRSEELVKERLELVAQAIAVTTDPARVSVAVLQLAQLVDQLEVFQKHVAIFDAEIQAAFAEHPEAYLFRDLPGAGRQLAPRLCAAFGSDRSAYPDPANLQKYAGLAPVREKSGKQLWTHWRWNAPKFLRQTFVEWAGQTARYCPWSRTYYQRMAKKGKPHAVIIRALAFKWVRILWKCWQQRVPYSEAQFLKQLAHRKSPNAPLSE
jgi:transposase